MSGEVVRMWGVNLSLGSISIDSPIKAAQRDELGELVAQYLAKGGKIAEVRRLDGAR